MNKLYFIFSIIFSICLSLNAQDYELLLIDVDTIGIGGSPGHLNSIDTDATPIVSGDQCNDPLLHYVVANTHGSGRVVAIAHEGIMSDGNFNNYDNGTFQLNVINWLNEDLEKRVTLKTGWINNGNTSIFQAGLAENGYTFNSVNSVITEAVLEGADVLVLGNDWNGSSSYTEDEVIAINNFVFNGGGVLILGLGWSWPGVLEDYPMNQVAKLFGIEYTTEVIFENVFTDFYPDNTETSTPYCPFYGVNENISRGTDLRIIRLAVSTMGEFTQQSGGVDNTIDLIEPWLEQINETYGREYCMRFEIIENNDLLIFDDPATDPWDELPAGSGGCTNAGIILSQQASVIDGIIGAANYDLSHVIAGSPFGGGCAGGLKTGLSGGFDLSVTRHEIGHQFGQSHTINYSNRNNYEPESGGWSIQGGNQHGYAHAVSFHQLAERLLQENALIGDKISTGNSIPSANAGKDVIIPFSTPFALKGLASDEDENDVLSYVWDNLDRGVAQTIPVTNEAQGALFMRLLPTTDSVRIFPNIEDVIANNNSNTQEQLPTAPRIMPIRLTVNDNHEIEYQGEMIKASGISSDDIIITVADAGPFEVTSQSNEGIIYVGGTEQLITWNVNGTDSAPINTQNVKISLSYDGGYTYPYVLNESTINSGSAMVLLPNEDVFNARVKVEAVDNIYFDINTHDFEIQQDIANFTSETASFLFGVHPNPTTGIIDILYQDERDFTVKLYDTYGTLLLQKSNPKQLDISTYNAGIYFIEIKDSTNNNATIKKVVLLN